MSLLVPLAAAGIFYLMFQTLQNRTDKEVDQMHSKDECQHKGADPPNPHCKYIDLADVVSDKTQYDCTNYTVADEAWETADGRARCDLMSRHGRCVAGLAGVE